MGRFWSDSKRNVPYNSCIISLIKFPHTTRILWLHPSLSGIIYFLYDSTFVYDKKTNPLPSPSYFTYFTPDGRPLKSRLFRFPHPYLKFWSRLDKHRYKTLATTTNIQTMIRPWEGLSRLNSVPHYTLVVKNLWWKVVRKLPSRAYLSPSCRKVTVSGPASLDHPLTFLWL